ncbi:MAG: PHB depolymerase family esterase [Flavihumibacter sp.]
MKNTCLVALAALLLSTACRKETTPGEGKLFRFTDTLLVNGMKRSYVLNLPTGYYTSGGFSLVIAMHGGGGSATQFESSSKLTEKANSAGFVVVYPEGTGAINTWNAGNCCGSAVNNKIDDVQFISRLIDHLLANYSIDPKKVYATGHSRC